MLFLNSRRNYTGKYGVVKLNQSFIDFFWLLKLIFF